MTIWSSDFHISPIADIKFSLNGSVNVIDKSLSGHCGMMNTCQRDLRIINHGNGITLGHCPNSLIESFYLSYRNDSQLTTVDAFICNHAFGMCEMFMPFNKPIIMIASTRYELGRHSAKRWECLNSNIRRISKKPGSLIAANNRYDQEYLKYFTAAKRVMLIPSLCEYVAASYRPTKAEILLFPSRGINAAILKDFERASLESQSRIIHVREMYKAGHKYSDLANHPAAVILPYQGEKCNK
jgi:hypothetical protein